MRGLTATFFNDLQSGLLLPLLERLRLDQTLDMQIRNDYLNVYYRGGNLLRLAATPNGYSATFNVKYAGGAALQLPPMDVVTAADVDTWLATFPAMKQAMDLSGQIKEERQIQQRIARDNNRSSVSRATDFYVCDIEYASPHGQFDLIAVRWPSTPSKRKQSSGRRLIIGEVKQGDSALTTKAGVHAHVRDVDAFLSDPARVQDLKAEMVTVFNQKRDLGLLDEGRELVSFSDERPMLLFIFVNHDPDSAVLRRELMSLPTTTHCEVMVATSSLMGYGLFDPWLRTVDQILAQPQRAL